MISDLITAFCLECQDADAIQVQALEGPHLLKDVAELRNDWGDDRPEGVLKWALAAPGDRLVLTALRKTGERRGADEEWVQTRPPVEVLRSP